MRRPSDGREGAAPGAVPDLILAQLRGAARAARQVFGIPDYGRYLDHARATHPERPVMSEREFHAFAIDRRYGGMGARCC
jgi:uncharacterized short protein YbdD (DUF466 family)